MYVIRYLTGLASIMRLDPENPKALAYIGGLHVILNFTLKHPDSEVRCMACKALIATVNENPLC